jgi:virginiamycin B lyase
MHLTKLALVALSLSATAAEVQAQLVPNLEWPIEWGGRPRDPYVAPDGIVYFAGQAGNYVGRLDPRSGQTRRYELPPNTNPHTVVVGPDNHVWIAGNRNGTIGRMNPATGDIRWYPMPDSTVRDPHTMIFDRDGNLWFTAQNSNAVGHMNVQTGAIRFVKTARDSRPYGIDLNSRGEVWFNLFGTNKIGRINPRTYELTTYDLPHERARGRRIAITPDDVVWYTDYTRGMLGRLDPTNGRVTEVPLPGGPASLPYGMARDAQGRVWVTESGPKGAILQGYDPSTGRFFGRTLIGKEENNTIRHMYFDPRTGLLWFGTDAGTVGRAEVSRARTAM